jgi:trk system potassium uptake protein
MRHGKSLLTPLRISVLSFALFILVGAFLLTLPMSYTDKPVRFVDALFTITSAACVTGLTVLDTGKDFSRAGQVIILTWIQVGGLGIMTLSTVFLLFARKRPGLGSRMVIQDTFTHSGERDLGALVGNVLVFTFTIEMAGALLLFIRFGEGRPLGEAVYLSVFHSISAFCNAGFSTFSDSLEGFVGDWLVSLTICFLIILGGIGFLVMREIRTVIRSGRKKQMRLSLHTKLVLTTTASLLVAGTVLILIMEWNNTLAKLAIPERMLASFFQSVTPRTAGFNTLPYGAMANQTLFVTILFMFIGASSGSTGGGIKTGTFATLVALGWSRFLGHEQPQVFHRTISPGSVGRAMSVTMVCALLVVLGTMILQITEIGAGPQAAGGRGKFLELLFEVTSAFGTVGLSTGVTPTLTDLGKLLITFVMFLGRLGPLVVAVAVSRQKPLRYRHAEEGIMIG